MRHLVETWKPKRAAPYSHSRDRWPFRLHDLNVSSLSAGCVETTVNATTVAS